MLGGPATDNMYHAGWAWAGGTPFKGTKLLGAYFGGTRNPMVVAWPGHIAPDGAMRSQFAHVVDIAPTIYDVLDITPPQVVNGFEQMPIDGASLAYTFADADGARGQARAVLRQQRQPRHLAGRLVRRHLRAVHPLGHAGLGDSASPPGTRPRTSGSSTTCAPTSPRPTTSPPSSRRGSRR